jgi:hypothetical protein
MCIVQQLSAYFCAYRRFVDWILPASNVIKNGEMRLFLTKDDKRAEAPDDPRQLEIYNRLQAHVVARMQREEAAMQARIEYAPLSFLC